MAAQDNCDAQTGLLKLYAQAGKKECEACSVVGDQSISKARVHAYFKEFQEGRESVMSETSASDALNRGQHGTGQIFH